jgi:hypothetical protein
MTSIPGKKLLEYWQKKWVVELFGIGPPVVAAAILAWRLFLDSGTKDLAWFAVFGVIWLLIAGWLKVRHAFDQEAKESREHEHDGLLGALHVLRGSVLGHLNLDGKKPNDLRATIHRVDKPGPNAEWLEQLLPYVGGAGGDAGRKFRTGPGVIGQAARTSSAVAWTRQNNDNEEFVSELVSVWGYTEEDARKLSADRQTSIAVPILNNKGLSVAVVYLDSAKRDLFIVANRPIVFNACAGIASYIHERYK